MFRGTLPISDAKLLSQIIWAWWRLVDRKFFLKIILIGYWNWPAPKVIRLFFKKKLEILVFQYVFLVLMKFFIKFGVILVSNCVI